MDVPPIKPDSKGCSPPLQADGLAWQPEEIGSWFAKRQGKNVPENLNPAIVLFAADHGVSYSPQKSERRLTTAQRVLDAASNDSDIRTLAEAAGASLQMINLGVRGDISGAAGIEQRVIRASGTADIRLTSAMSHDEYRKAIETGKEIAEKAIDRGANLLAAGSLASRDHISTSAMICELAGVPPEEAVASKSHDTYADELLALDTVLTRPHTASSHNILREFGGIELAAMAGFYYAAAQRSTPVLLDGTASTVAALAASTWDVRTAGWMLASFISDDIACHTALEELGLEALMPMKQGAGDGTGAALLMPLLQSAITLRRGLASIEH